jgi:hypothetical protein
MGRSDEQGQGSIVMNDANLGQRGACFGLFVPLTAASLETVVSVHFLSALSTGRKVANQMCCFERLSWAPLSHFDPRAFISIDNLGTAWK